MESRSRQQHMEPNGKQLGDREPVLRSHGGIFGEMNGMPCVKSPGTSAVHVHTVELTVYLHGSTRAFKRREGELVGLHRAARKEWLRLSLSFVELISPRTAKCKQARSLP